MAATIVDFSKQHASKEVLEKAKEFISKYSKQINDKNWYEVDKALNTVGNNYNRDWPLGAVKYFIYNEIGPGEFIDNFDFYGCNWLIEFVFPADRDTENVSYHGVFEGAMNLVELTIPEGLDFNGYDFLPYSRNKNLVVRTNNEDIIEQCRLHKIKRLPL